MKKKTELKVGDIWGVPKTLEIRTIRICYRDGGVDFIDIGDGSRIISDVAFYAWVTRKKAVLIGRYDFKTGKAVAVKGGKR